MKLSVLGYRAEYWWVIFWSVIIVLVVLLLIYIVIVSEDSWSGDESLCLIWVQNIIFLTYLSFPSKPNLDFDLSDYQGKEFNQVNCHTHEYDSY